MVNLPHLINLYISTAYDKCSSASKILPSFNSPLLKAFKISVDIGSANRSQSTLDPIFRVPELLQESDGLVYSVRHIFPTITHLDVEVYYGNSDYVLDFEDALLTRNKALQYFSELLIDRSKCGARPLSLLDDDPTEDTVELSWRWGSNHLSRWWYFRFTAISE